MSKQSLPKMWFRASHGTYFVTTGGKQVNLGSDEQAAIRKYGQILAGATSHLPKDDITFVNLVKEHFHNEDFKSEKTKDAYRNTMWVINAWFPQQLLAEDVRAFAVTKWLDRQDLGPAAYNKRVSHVLRVLNWGVAMGYISTNPVSGIKKKQENIREDFIPPELLLEFVEAIPNQEGRFLARFMLETGARVREVRFLTWEDYDPKRRCFTLLRENSKGKKKKRVIFCSQVAHDIVTHMRTLNDNVYLFVNTRGTQWTPQSMKNMFDRAATTIGLDFKVCGTVLRHSFAHHRLTQGQDVATVSKLLGHSSTDMVYKIYGHLDKGSLMEKAADAVKLGDERCKNLC